MSCDGQFDRKRETGYLFDSAFPWLIWPEGIDGFRTRWINPSVEVSFGAPATGVACDMCVFNQHVGHDHHHRQP